jgi:hypothetical protein
MITSFILLPVANKNFVFINFLYNKFLVFLKITSSLIFTSIQSVSIIFFYKKKRNFLLQKKFRLIIF